MRAKWVPGQILPFVGRDSHLEVLLAEVAAAERGEATLALLGGEGGVGKSRLARELAARVSADALWATCWDGEGRPPYWPWVQVLRGLARLPQRPGGPAPRQEGPAGALLGRAHPAELDEAARFGMFDAVVDTLAEASLGSPLVLVVEDLHWADEPSLRLLEFLAQDRRPRRLAVVGTYRDDDLALAPALVEVLPRLGRGAVHLSIGGLSAQDVRALLEAVGSEPREAVVSALLRASGGNPFLLGELLALDTSGGGALDPSLLPGVPGVRDVVDRRLARVAPATRLVLEAASVVGAEFDVPLVRAAAEAPTASVVASLEEATRSGLVSAVGHHRFGFVHSLVREVVYARIPADERATRHRAVAQDLQRRHGDRRLPEIAHHMLRTGDTALAVDLAARAADRSGAALAYEEAADWYERALRALRADPAGVPDPALETDLLLRCGEAHLAAGDVPQARGAYGEAAGLARARGDAERLAWAALGVSAGLGGFEVRMLDRPQVELLEEAIAALDHAPSRLRVLLLTRLSVALSFLQEEERRSELSLAAVGMAREVGDDAALGYALAGHCDTIAGPGHCERRLSEASEIVQLARRAGDRRLELLGRRVRLVALLETGATSDADAEIVAFRLTAEQLRQPLYTWYVPLWLGMRAVMRGELDAADRLRAEAEEIGRRAHSDNAVPLVFTQWWYAERCRGRFAEAGATMARLLGDEPSGVLVTAGVRAVAAAMQGHTDRARVLLEQWFGAGFGDRPHDSEWLPETAQLAQVAVLTDSVPIAERLYADLLPHAGRFCVEGIGAAVSGSVEWYLAELARFLGRGAVERRHRERAAQAHLRAGLVGDPPPLGPAPRQPPTPQPETRPAVSADPGPSLLLEGATWRATYQGTSRSLRDSKGLRDLSLLLTRPGREVHCLELAGGVDVGDAGPVVDDQARRAYEQRIRELHEEVEHAALTNDLARAERAELELDQLVQQLSAAYGLSGRRRTTGSAVERARSAVTWRIRSSMRHIAQAHPELGRHLQNSVRTGTWCSYHPEVPLTWRVQRGG